MKKNQHNLSISILNIYVQEVILRVREKTIVINAFTNKSLLSIKKATC